MVITKISRTEKRVPICFEKQATKKSQPEEHVLSCREAPLPSFDSALQALIPFVAEICQLPDIEDRTKIKGVSLSTKNDVLFAIITASIATTGAPGPFTINTPRLPESSDNNFNLGQKCATAIAKLVEEAGKYVRGERMQGELLGAKDEPVSAEEEAENNKKGPKLL